MSGANIKGLPIKALALLGGPIGHDMKDRIIDFLSSCTKIGFGPVNLSEEEDNFRKDLNQEMLSFCGSLPKSTQAETALFLVQYLRTTFTNGLNFIRYFYAPAWSILFWLIRSCPDGKKLDPKEIEDAKAAHTMAMFLHAFDDHLTDGQLPITHLTLLIRSQSWMLMNQAFERLAKGVEKGPNIVRGFIDDYYSSIGKSDEIKSLDGYCELFRKQMATWLIVPVLLARRMSIDEEFTHSIQTAYCSFGISWRLLDDLQDIEKDMVKGAHSSLYFCLPDEIKRVWDQIKDRKESGNGDHEEQVVQYILENRSIDIIRRRICRELESAASLVSHYDLAGLADEFRSMMNPLRTIEDH